MVELLDRVKSQAPEMLSDIFECDPAESPIGSTATTDAVDTTAALQELLDMSQSGQPVQIGAFVIENQVGSGGSGVVFRARDARLNVSWH